ncbi:MAG: LysM peptidoglycan-binding domain-containing protein [Nitrospirae bacterium]|nr:LysM peptidoglycan-binding domain-containing protein [Nitrospirota bacterium]
MLNRKLILIIVIVLLNIASFAGAQELEIKDYKVQQGDTLWDISEKELNDPFLWPKVWKENPDIANPDRIMPGQIIKIPLYLIRKEVLKEEPVAEPVVEITPQKTAPVAEPAPVKIKPLVDANLYISSGYIAGTVNELGKIIGSPSGKTLLGAPDMIFIKTKAATKLGDRFFIMRKGPIVRHPVTKEVMGYLIDITGIAEVKKFEFGETIAQITKTFSDAGIGDTLDTYTEITPPTVAKPYRKPDVKGYIVEARHLRLNNGFQYDIVYIDRGKRDGLEAGDLLKTASIGKHTVSNGIIQVINVSDATSVAIVRSSTDSISKGNLITAAD